MWLENEAIDISDLVPYDSRQVLIGLENLRAAKAAFFCNFRYKIAHILLVFAHFHAVLEIFVYRLNARCQTAPASGTTGKLKSPKKDQDYNLILTTIFLTV